MEADFERALAFTLREEGGNVDDPHDHGGRTSRGVTQARYNTFRKARGQRPADVWKATAAEIKDIYRSGYWQPWCSKLPAGIDLMFFDIAVNAGPDQAARMLQKALGSVQVDGTLGAHTLDAIAEHTDIERLVRDYCAKRVAFYKALRQFPRYGKGWIARAARAQRAALALVASQVPAESVAARVEAPIAPTLGPNPAAIAHPDDVAQPPVSTEAGVAATTGGATALAIVTQAQTQLQAFAGTIETLQYVLLGLTIIALGLTAYGFIHHRNVKAAVA